MRGSHRSHLLLLLASLLPSACSAVWGFEDGTPAPASPAGGAGAVGGAGGGLSSGGAGDGGGLAGSGGVTATGGQGTGGACAAGTTEDLGACGNCGTLRRTCEPAGVWGLAVCADEGECQPGTTSTPVPCGNCGGQTSTCTETCTWGPLGACTNEGVCAPTTRRDCMCSTNVTTHCCGDEVCNDQCQWNACVFKAGAECDWQGGYNWECCSTPGQRHWCLPECVWPTNCISTTAC